MAGVESYHGIPEDTEGRYRLRKRQKSFVRDFSSSNIEILKDKANSCTRIVVFSGSGLSATSGMSTFSTKGGLYERAKAKYKLADGKNLFTYSFYSRNRKHAEAFLADVYLEALEATPAPGHYALAALANSGKLVRHYTLNIDGLASKAGMDVWDPEKNPSGMTVEMHGSIHEMVCTSCGSVSSLTVERAGRLREEMPLPCEACQDGSARFKVMMYDDADGEYITPDDVMDLMEEDVKEADLILWVGISFQQSASTTYFRNTRHWLQEVSKHETVVQAVINPSEEALWNVLTALSNQHELNILEVLGTADTVLPLLAHAVGTVDTNHNHDEKTAVA